METLPDNNQSQVKTEDERNVDAVRDGLIAHDRVRLLGKMIGLKSIGRNMSAEDAAIRRNLEACDRDILGAEAMGGKGSDDDMEIMAARDVIVNYGQNETATAASVVPQVPKAASKIAGLAKTAAVVAGLVGGPLAGSAITAWMLNKPSVGVTTPAPEFNQDIYDIDGVVTPIE